MVVLMTPLMRNVAHALELDLACIGLVALAAFYRRYRRADLVVAYVALNVSLFAVAVLIVNEMKVGVAFGFGLFAILSIIRLRSEPISPEEGAYYFVSLVLGLINGMVFRNAPLARMLDVGVVVVILVVDNGFIGVKARRQVVTLDRVYPDEGALRVDVESRLSGKVKRLFVRETDYVRETTVVDVRYVPRTRQPRALPWRRAEERDLHEVIS